MRLRLTGLSSVWGFSRLAGQMGCQHFFINLIGIQLEGKLFAVRHFFLTGFLHLRINSTKVVLLPKVPNPTNMGRYWPISLCNIVYKVIAKILANWLRPLLSNLICPT